MKRATSPEPFTSEKSLKQEKSDSPASSFTSKDLPDHLKQTLLDSSDLTASLLTKDHFTCSVCTDVLKDPVSIPCGHSYCRQCITSHWAQPNHAGHYACPQCSHTYSSCPALYTNSALADVIQKLQRFSPVPPAHCYAGPGDVACDFCTGRKLRAVKSCLTCSASYCESHIREHYTVEVLQRHTLVEPQIQEQKLNQQHDINTEEECKGESFIEWLDQLSSGQSPDADQRNQQGTAALDQLLISLLDSPAPSCESQWSMEESGNFSGALTPHGLRLDSPAPSCESQWSMEEPGNFSGALTPPGLIEFRASVLMVDHFRCSVCADLLKDPVSIPCGHSYCRQCITSYLDQPNHAGHYACPQCSHTYSSCPALYTNSALAVVVQKRQQFSPVPPAHCYVGPELVDCGLTVKNKVRKEEPSGDGGKGSTMEISMVEDRKMEVTTNPKEEEEASTPSATSSSPAGAQSNKNIFKPEELRQALMPTLEALFRQNPESLPFRQPVNPMLLGIPDYFDIVKNPMDLSTIKRKLDTGWYQEPWQYVEDIWLMFNNAWLYNHKTLLVYKYCSKLAEVLEQRIDSIMQGLGYCCGRKLEFYPQTLCCYGKQQCTIPRDAAYFSYQNRYHFCEKCFSEIQGESVSLGDDPTKPQTSISKDLFEKKKNDTVDPETFSTCLDCGRKMHQICVLHHKIISPSGFICNGCLKKSNKSRKENKYTAKRLPQTRLSSHVESRVNQYLRRQAHPEAGDVTIRIVHISDKVMKVKPGMKSRFVDSGEMAESFPYRSKVLFAFEDIDGADVCFFGMHVQEYGSDCPPPNQRRVHISYLDSVHFFQPHCLRTAVYHEIHLGYLDYVKRLGFTHGHIWACPPSEEDDYIFHCHPVDQKIPKPKRLQEWYKKMLDKALAEQIVHDYKDIFKQATEDCLTSAKELPYFEDDFWPNILEDSIKELEEERKREENSTSNESDDGTNDDSKNGKNNKETNENKNNLSRANKKKPGMPNLSDDLSQKLYATMEKYKEVFFVIQLIAEPNGNTLLPIDDPDPLMECDLMDGRDTFLALARDKHLEFSSLRRSKWSSMCMLVELHNQSQDRIVYTCKECKNHVETRFHCTVCEDYDLCGKCYNIKDHEHEMEKLGLGLDDESNNQTAASTQNPSESRRLSIQRCIQYLVHACQCRNTNCSLPSCQKIKRVVQHTEDCKRKTNGGCPICKQLIALCCYHAKHCQENKCPAPFCLNIKHKLRQQQLQHRLQRAQMMRRRMAAMLQRPGQPMPQQSGLPQHPMHHQFQPGGSGGMMNSPQQQNRTLQQQQQQQAAQQAQQQMQHPNRMATYGARAPGSSPRGQTQGKPGLGPATPPQPLQKETPQYMPNICQRPMSQQPPQQQPPSRPPPAAMKIHPHPHHLQQALASCHPQGLPPQAATARAHLRQLQQVPPDDGWYGISMMIGAVPMQLNPQGQLPPQVPLQPRVGPQQEWAGQGMAPQQRPVMMGQMTQPGMVDAQQQQQPQQQIHRRKHLLTLMQQQQQQMQQQQQQPQQQIPGRSPLMQGGTSSSAGTGNFPQGALQDLLRTLRSPSSPLQQQQVLNILRTNPQLMAAFIKQRVFKNKGGADGGAPRSGQPGVKRPMLPQQVAALQQQQGGIPGQGPSMASMANNPQFREFLLRRHLQQQQQLQAQQQQQMANDAQFKQPLPPQQCPADPIPPPAGPAPGRGSPSQHSSPMSPQQQQQQQEQQQMSQSEII